MGKLDETVDEPTTVPQAQHVARELIGTFLGPYRIEALLGEGAMGEVFRATHVELRRPVAIKTLKPAVAADRSLTERFFAEARAVNIIRHENIVDCTDLVNEPAGKSYIVMELLEGKTLGALIRELGRVPPPRAARITAQIADAIGAAHAKDIVHRDLKPENVMLIRRAGSPDYVKVLDFGIARLRPEHGAVSSTQAGALVGTPAYMSPEQARGEAVGPSADIYALGAMLFHMLTGRVPFEAASLSQMLAAQLRDTPPRVDALVKEVPKALADVVASALAKSPADWPEDMAALRAAVLAAAPDTDGLATESDAPGRRPADPDHPHRRRAWLYALPICAALAGAAAVFALSGSRTRDKPLEIPAGDVEQQKFDNERHPEKIIAALGIKPGWRVADVGADTGKLTVHLARAVGPTGKVVATDVDGGVLSRLRERVERNGLGDRVEPREVGADAPGLESGMYDVILVAQVDHFFGDAAGWFAAAKRALNPTGRLAVSNRLDRRQHAMTAAAKAGLVVESEAAVTPQDYIAVFAAKQEEPLDDVPIIPAADIKRIPGGFACTPGTKALTATAVDDALAEIKQRGGFDDAGLDRAIARQGLTRAQYRSAIERQLAVLGCRCPTGYMPKRDPQDFAICSRAGKRYECAPYGKPESGVGCSCMDGYVSTLDADNVYHCVKAS